MEGTASTIQTAIANMAQTVATDGVNMIGAIVPKAAPLVAASIVAVLGYKFVRRFFSK